MKLSARNQLAGTVSKIISGPVNAEVIVQLPGGAQIVSVITAASAKELGLKKGSCVCAVVKASDVMIGVCQGRNECDCGQHG
jgi:molybdate transport system regulatory protein